MISTIFIILYVMFALGVGFGYFIQEKEFKWAIVAFVFGSIMAPFAVGYEIARVLGKGKNSE